MRPSLLLQTAVDLPPLELIDLGATCPRVAPILWGAIILLAIPGFFALVGLLTDRPAAPSRAPDGPSYRRRTIGRVVRLLMAAWGMLVMTHPTVVTDHPAAALIEQCGLNGLPVDGATTMPAAQIDGP